MPLSEKAVRDALNKVLSLVKAVDAKAQAHVVLESTRSANVRFARNEITTGGESDESAVGLTVTLGLRGATGGTNQLDDASLKTLAERTVAMARSAPEDPETLDVLGPQKYGRCPSAFDPEVDGLTAATRAKIANEIITQGLERKLQVAGFLHHASGFVSRATSAGLLAIHPSTSMSLSITARSADGSGSGYANAATRRRAELDPGAMAKRACDTALASASPAKLEPGRYTVILEPLASAALTESLVEAMDARAADEGRSFFSKPGGTREGEALASKLVTIRSDWASPSTPSLPFDADGIALTPQTWVDQGVIKTLRCSRFWAKKRARKSTGALSTLQLAPGTTSREAMIKGVKRGVLITRFWYTNWVDPQTLLLTGLTRDGTFLIENGELTGAVNNFRFNQSVIDAFAKVDALGDSVELVDDEDARAPVLRTHDFLLASVSEAV